MTARRLLAILVGIWVVLALLACGGSSSNPTNADGDTEAEGPQTCDTSAECPSDQVCSGDGLCVPYVEPDGDDEEAEGETSADGDTTLDGPLIRVDPAAGIDFGSTNEARISRMLDIYNDGNKTLYLSIVDFLIIKTTAFVIDPPVAANTTIAPGSKLSITIVFTPPADCKKYEIPLSIVSNAANNPALQVTMKSDCKGVSALVVDPCSLDFGSVRTGQSFAKPVKICNNGTDNKPITITTIALTNSATAGDFELVLDSKPTPQAPLAIRPGDANCLTFNAVYHPQEPTVYPDTDKNNILILHDADQNSLCAPSGTQAGNLSVPLNGISGDYALAISPSPIAFGSVEKTTPSCLTLTLANQTTTDVKVSKAELTGVHCDEFKILANGSSAASQTLDLTVKASDVNRDLQVCYTPTNTGLDTGCKFVLRTDLMIDNGLVKADVTGTGIEKRVKPVARISQSSHGSEIKLPVVLPPDSSDKYLTFFGDSSYDPDNAMPLSYHWTLLSKPDQSNASAFPSTSSCTLQWDLPGTYILELIVTDADALDSDPKTVTIIVGQDQKIVITMTATVEGQQRAELSWRAPNGVSCSATTMNAFHACDFGAFGTAMMPDSEGSIRTIVQREAPDGQYTIAVKYEEDCRGNITDLNCLAWGRSSTDVTVKIYVDSATEPTYTIPTFTLAAKGAIKSCNITKASGKWNAPICQ